MARARNLKPGFFKNEDLAECSSWARLCFAGLWTLADREGRLEDRPKRIKGELFAFDSLEVEPLLAELDAHGFLVRYRNSDGAFIQVSKFRDHQTPHYSEKPSVIKPPPLQESRRDEGSPTPGVLQESTEKVVAMKRGSQPPSSLNPDCPNPSSSNPDSGNPESSPPGPVGPPGKARKRAASPAQARPEAVTEQVWNDWLALRKSKRAPVTATVIAGAQAEAKKAGLSLDRFLAVWCSRGSQGLEAAWLKPDERRAETTEAHDAVVEGARRLLYGDKSRA